MITIKPKTQEEILEKLVKDIEQAVQDTLDSKAKEYRYDNMMSARSYAGYVNPFQEEATKLAVWASNCWVKVGEIEALGEVVTVEYVLEQLPKYGELVL